MFKRSVRLMATAALVVGALTACDQRPGPTGVTESPPAERVNVSPYKTIYNVTTAAAYVQETGATLASTESEDFGEVATTIIGRDGGTLRAGDHTLVIPPDAVDEDTWFRMEVVPGANILVDLSAVEIDDREPVYVFDEPLTLVLSYKDVLQGVDASDLRNVYLYLDSPKYMIPLVSKVDETSRTIISQIEHFSLYGMAIE